MRGRHRRNIIHISAVYMEEELESKEVYQYFSLCEEDFRRAFLYLIHHICLHCV